MKIFNLGLCVLLCVLSACTGEDLVTDISNRQSLETIVRLSEAGISIKRTKTKNLPSPRYSLKVASKDYQRAVSVLHKLGLPKDDSESFESLLKNKGFVPNPKEISAARLDAALAREVERLISILPSVVEVRAIVRSNLVSTRKPESSNDPTASVVVRHIVSDKRPLLSREEIKSVISRAVPGLNNRDISVNLSGVDIQALPRSNSLPIAANLLPGYDELWKDSTTNSIDNPLTPLLILLGFVGIATFCLGFIGGKSSLRARSHPGIASISGNQKNIDRSLDLEQPKLNS